MQTIRGVTTASENSIEAIREAISELLDELETRNELDPAEIVSITFSATHDLDAIFPSAIARERHRWSDVPMLDVQQMHIESNLERCIRLLIYFNIQEPCEAAYLS